MLIDTYILYLINIFVSKEKKLNNIQNVSEIIVQIGLEQFYRSKLDENQKRKNYIRGFRFR